VPDPPSPFSTNLRFWRLERNLTQDQVADAAGMTQGYYSRIERGLVSPTIRTAVRLAAALDVDMGALLPREPPAPSS
jgi:transcriptional regulator with XRE-family HTH domain